jgi:hypothetical protein
MELKKLLALIFSAIIFLCLPTLVGATRIPERITAETIVEYLADTVVFYIRLVSIFVKTLLNKL